MPRKSISFIFSLIFSFFVLVLSVHAAVANYVPLAEIKTPSEVVIGTTGNLGDYFSQMYMLLVGVATALAVLMVIWGGVEYVTTDAIGGKEEGKQKIQNAILGLLLALGSYLILQTINPALLETNLQIKETEVKGKKLDSSSATITPTAGAGSASSANAWSDWTATDQKNYDDAQRALAENDALGPNEQNKLTAEQQAAVDKATTNYNRQQTINSSITNGTFNKGGATGNGSIAKSSVAGTTFPTKSGITNEEVISWVNQSGITSLPLSDADKAKYFPGGTVTAAGYASLLASIAKSESGFNPNDNTNNSHVDYYDKTTGKPVYSVGLFSLSVEDPVVIAVAKKYKVTAQDVLSSPTYNTQAAVTILKNQVEKQKSIAGGATTGYWGPLRRGE
ncbi:MAG: hypothetical protein WCV55_03515 [Candidatus Paceibacterota bacterium]